MQNFKRGPCPLSKEEITSLMNRNELLSHQQYDDIKQIEINKLNLIRRQSTINIVVLGHVTHGKSKLVQRISKKQKPQCLSLEEKIDYTNAKIFKCLKCPQPQCFQSFSSNQQDKTSCQFCSEIMELQKHITLIDCNKHDLLMTKLLSNAIQFDNTLLIVAANKNCPEQQAREQLAIIRLLGLKNMIIVQNKIDLAIDDKDSIIRNYEEIIKFISESPFETSPIIPISACLNYNIDLVLQQICNSFNVSPQRIHAPPQMIVVKSFDHNNPWNTPENLIGGTVQGCIIQGIFSVGVEIEIRPILLQDKKWGSLTTRIVSLKQEKNDLLYAVPGGLIDVELLLDRSLTRNNRLAGCVIGAPNNITFNLYIELDINYYLFTKKKEFNLYLTIKKIKKEETLKFYIWSQVVKGVVVAVTNVMKVKFNQPICANIQDRVAFSRRIQNKFRFIGWGQITDGQQYQI